MAQAKTSAPMQQADMAPISFHREDGVCRHHP